MSISVPVCNKEPVKEQTIQLKKASFSELNVLNLGLRE
jgi:hypothetical protein